MIALLNIFFSSSYCHISISDISLRQAYAIAIAFSITLAIVVTSLSCFFAFRFFQPRCEQAAAAIALIAGYAAFV